MSNKKPMNKKQEESKEIDVEQPKPISIELHHKAVSILVREKDGKKFYDIVKINFDTKGNCSLPIVLNTTNNEATAIIYLTQAAHENCNPYKLKKGEN